jgi:hypothetical protein
MEWTNQLRITNTMYQKYQDKCQSLNATFKCWRSLKWLMIPFPPCLKPLHSPSVYNWSRSCVRFQVLTAASMMLRAVWRLYAPLKRRSTIILHGSITQKTALNEVEAPYLNCVVISKLLLITGTRIVRALVVAVTRVQLVNVGPGSYRNIRVCTAQGVTQFNVQYVTSTTYLLSLFFTRSWCCKSLQNCEHSQYSRRICVPLVSSCCLLFLFNSSFSVLLLTKWKGACVSLITSK